MNINETITNDSMKRLEDLGLKVCSLDEQVIIDKWGIDLFTNKYRDFFFDFDTSKYFSDVTIGYLYNTFDFERKLKNLLLEYIMLFEIDFRNVLTAICNNYMNSNYLPCIYYNESFQSINDFLFSVHHKFRTDFLNADNYLDTYLNIPPSIFFSLLSINELKEYYLLLNASLQEEVSKCYMIDRHFLKIILDSLSKVKRRILNNYPLINAKFVDLPSDLPLYEALGIPLINGRRAYGVNKCYSLCIILKYILHDDDFNQFIDKLIILIDTFNILVSKPYRIKILSAIGIPHNIEEIKSVVK